MRGHRWADEPAAWEAMRKKVPESVADAFSPIEAEYLRGPWVMGERLSVCDYYLFTIARWLEADGVDLAKLPRVVEHRARVAALPLAQRVIAQYEGKPSSAL
jgi:glutathione S-transferase